jgi:hypothetical protein
LARCAFNGSLGETIKQVALLILFKANKARGQGHFNRLPLKRNSKLESSPNAKELEAEQGTVRGQADVAVQGEWRYRFALMVVATR